MVSSALYKLRRPLQSADSRIRMALCGGLGSAKKATEEVQALCDQVRAEVEEKHGKKYPKFVAVEYKTQMVAGTNFFVKVLTGDEEYIHLRLYKTLPHAGEELSLSATQVGKTKADEIVHFQ